MLTWPLATSTKADEKKFESRVNCQQRCYISKSIQMLTLLPPAVEACEWVQWPEDRLRGKIFPFEKKWGSPITQDTTCLMTALSHYGLLMWLSVGKLPSLPLPWWISPWLPNVENGKRSFLLNFPVLKKQTSMIWRGCFAHNFTAIQRTFICTNTRRRDHYIKISHAWLQTEVFFSFGLIAIYTAICLRKRPLDGKGAWVSTLFFFPQPIHLKHLYLFSDLLKAVFVLTDIFLAKLCSFTWISLEFWPTCVIGELHVHTITLTEPLMLCFFFLQTRGEWRDHPSFPFQTERTSCAAPNGIPLNAEAVVWTAHQSISFSRTTHL